MKDIFDDKKLYLKTMGTWVYLSCNFRKNCCIDKDKIKKSLRLSQRTAKKIFSELCKIRVIKNEQLRKEGRISGSRTVLIKKLTVN